MDYSVWRCETSTLARNTLHVNVQIWSLVKHTHTHAHTVVAAGVALSISVSSLASSSLWGPTVAI